MSKNELYLAVMPLVHINSGLTEETLTLFPSRELATEFLPADVERFLLMFQDRANKYLVGGEVKSYECEVLDVKGGRQIVRVYQNVV